jgi:hypothetical protein
MARAQAGPTAPPFVIVVDNSFDVIHDSLVARHYFVSSDAATGSGATPIEDRNEAILSRDLHACDALGMLYVVEDALTYSAADRMSELCWQVITGKRQLPAAYNRGSGGPITDIVAASASAISALAAIATAVMQARQNRSGRSSSSETSTNKTESRERRRKGKANG